MQEKQRLLYVHYIYVDSYLVSVILDLSLRNKEKRKTETIPNLG